MNYEEQLAEFFALNKGINLDGLHAVFMHDIKCSIFNDSTNCDCTPAFQVLSTEEYKEYKRTTDTVTALKTEVFQP